MRVKVADAVDQWAMWMGLFLKNNAYARLYFLIYVTVLHLWVFLIVTFQAHSFEEVHGDHQMMAISQHAPQTMAVMQQQQLTAPAIAGGGMVGVIPDPDRPSGQLGKLPGT